MPFTTSPLGFFNEGSFNWKFYVKKWHTLPANATHLGESVLDRKDKVFVAALVFAQTGLLITTISLSAQYWHHSMVDLQKMSHLYNFSQTLQPTNFKEQKKCEPEKQEQEKIIM